MKLAVISDIHSNFPALNAVLTDIPSVDGIICCGDVVGYYPHVNEVCDALRRYGVHTIRGNHDAYVTGQLPFDPAKSDIYKVEYTRATLTEENFRWLAGLPVELHFEFDGLSISVRHGSPDNEEEYIYPDSAKLDYLTLAENEIMIFGHTHHPMEITCGSGKVVNPGSVGQPRDWKPEPSYLIVDTLSKQIGFRRVGYGVSDFQQELRTLNWDPKAIDILSRRKQN